MKEQLEIETKEEKLTSQQQKALKLHVAGKTITEVAEVADTYIQPRGRP